MGDRKGKFLTETQIVSSDILEEVLSSAMKSGGSFAEIFVEDRRSPSAVLDDGLVEELMLPQVIMMKERER